MKKITSRIKNDDAIYLALSQRKKELKLSNVEISNDAAFYGIKIPPHSLSKYFKHVEENNISEQAVSWMCDRYCIDVSVNVFKKEYNEFEALLRLRIKYPKK